MANSAVWQQQKCIAMYQIATVWCPRHHLFGKNNYSCIEYWLIMKRVSIGKWSDPYPVVGFICVGGGVHHYS